MPGLRHHAKGGLCRSFRPDRVVVPCVGRQEDVLKVVVGSRECMPRCIEDAAPMKEVYNFVICNGDSTGSYVNVDRGIIRKSDEL